MSQDHHHAYSSRAGPPPSSSAGHWSTQAPEVGPYPLVDSMAYSQDDLSPHDDPSMHMGSPSSMDQHVIGDNSYLGQGYLTSPISPPNGTMPGSPMPGSQFFNMMDPLAHGGDEIISAAIEEDKRRRNTAASARFRMKKKEREAELERTTKNMADRCDELQRRISKLETENRWLRELITERSRNRGRRPGQNRSVEDKDREKEGERASEQRQPRGMRIRK
ncbi:hypothetical protein BT63DRAFT_454933 [Microthyrium microscopicum]|uniref:BZIP domain-containing protein n=1 Tax=Microthyrium microscopicum TaxID=703497 RepID=A0A6A6UC67_9PEZI|nr:hypothetical protein BT63DRAFT_454933 [Microthyrium microscopicum]